MAEIVQEESEAPKKDTTKENAKYNFTTSKMNGCFRIFKGVILS
jgi:hypothetical protein